MASKGKNKVRYAQTTLKQSINNSLAIRCRVFADSNRSMFFLYFILFYFIFIYLFFFNEDFLFQTQALVTDYKLYNYSL